jgi:hypothetical protein
VPNELAKKGAQPGKPARFGILWHNNFYQGIVTQRNPLRSNLGHIEAEFYGDQPTFIDGLNTEISTKLTLIRRPGTVVYNSQTFPAINRFYENRTSVYKNSQTVPLESIQVIADTASDIYDATGSSTKNLIFAKSAGAGSAYFQSVGNSLYFTDGPDQKKLLTPQYTWEASTSFEPGSLIAETLAGSTYVFMALGGVTLNIIASASDGTTFTFWCDPNTVPENFANLNGVKVNFTGLTAAAALNGTTAPVSVISETLGIFRVTFSAASYTPTADTGSATTGNGTTGVSAPAFSITQFSSTSDAGQQWKCYGLTLENWGLQPVTGEITITPGKGRFWSPNTSITAPYAILDSNQDVEIAKTNGTTGLSYPSWVTQTTGTSFAVVSVTQNANLVASRSIYAESDPSVPPPTGNAFQNTSGVAMIVTVSADSQGGGFEGYVFCDSSATPTTNVARFSRVNAGASSPDFYPANVTFCVPPNFYYVLSTTNGGDTGPAVLQTWTEYLLNGASSGSSTGSSTGSGSIGNSVQTIDNTVTWNNYGIPGSWQQNTSFDGPWDTSAPVGVITDSNGNWQYVTGGGGSVSGSTEPTWATAVGATTTDGGLTWTCLGPGSIITTYGWNWGFSTHGIDGSVSTSSPVASIYGPIVGPSVTSFSDTDLLTLTGDFTADDQIDQLWVWRSVQGGSTATLFLEDQIPSDSGTFSYSELGIPDTSLIIETSAPVSDENNPPPVGMTALSYHLGRVWGAVGNFVYPSNGPGGTGNGNTAWNPANFFEFPSSVIRTWPTTNGLIVFTLSDVYVIQGTTTASFFSTPFLVGTGLGNYDGFTVKGALPVFYTTDNQVLTLDPSSGQNEIGVAIGDQFGLENGTGTFVPSTVRVTWNFSGSQEKAIYVSDFSQNWWRFLPTPSPEPGTTWCPMTTIVGGFSTVQSVETAPAVHNLLLGPKTNGPILMRSASVYSDNGSPYNAYAVLGSLVLAQPGQLAYVKSITTDSQFVGSPITLKVQLDEIAPLSAGYFEDLTISVPDPTQLSPSNSVQAQRFYLSQTQDPAVCRHLQVLISFGNTDVVKNELLSLSIFGSFEQEL